MAVYHFKTLETKTCGDHHLVLVRFVLHLSLSSTCPFSFYLCQLPDLPYVSPFLVLLPPAHLCCLYYTPLVLYLLVYLFGLALILLF